MEDDYSEAPSQQLPMDIMYKILSHISDPASLARLASSCKFWHDLIKDPTFLDRLRRRHGDHGFTPSLLLGFFYQDNRRSSPDLWKYHIDKTRCLAPSFVRMSELTQFVGSKAARNARKTLSLETFIPGLAASSDGVVRWLCGSWRQMTLTHVATLHIGNMELSYLELPPEAKSNKAPLLGSSADGGLLLLFAQGLQMSLWKHSSAVGSDSSGWVLSERIDMRSSLPLRVGIRAKVRPEIFRGKSGTVVLWVDGEGLFLFSLSDRSLRKIDSEYVTKKYFLCPYEIDWLSCLAITNLTVDGSLSLDVKREKAQGRWRALMGTNLAANTAY
ncbi:hypothetical protein ACQ4PT_012788 [Festuca glaucescens]